MNAQIITEKQADFRGFSISRDASPAVIKSLLLSLYRGIIEIAYIKDIKRIMLFNLLLFTNHMRNANATGMSVCLNALNIKLIKPSSQGQTRDKALYILILSISRRPFMPSEQTFHFEWIYNVQIVNDKINRIKAINITIL